MSPLEGHENEVKSVSFNHEGTLVATCSRDKTIWIWERDEDQDFSCQAVCSGHTQDVKQVKWHPSENLLFSCSYDDSIKIWRHEESIDDWICTQTLTGHKSTVWQLDFSPCLEFLISCSQDQSLIVWRKDAASGEFKLFTRLENAHERAIYSVSWAKHGLIASVGADDMLRLLKFDQASSTLNVLFSVQAHDADINCVQWQPDGQKLATCSDDTKIKIWTFNQ